MVIAHVPVIYLPEFLTVKLFFPTISPTFQFSMVFLISFMALSDVSF